MLPKSDAPPRLTAHACPVGSGSAGEVCISVDETVALAKWIHQMREVQIALSGCSLVRFE